MGAGYPRRLRYDLSGDPGEDVQGADVTISARHLLAVDRTMPGRHVSPPTLAADSLVSYG